MNADQFTHPAGGCSSGIGCRLHGRDVTADYGRYKSGADLFVADKLYVRSFYHRVGRLDHSDEAFALYHS
jgi:hypothetical protein